MTGLYCFIICFGLTKSAPPTSEFCQVMDKLIQGTLTFTPQERKALGRINREDLASIKLQYRKCLK